jgi:uncharacterized protein (TIGR02271 family)
MEFPWEPKGMKYEEVTMITKSDFLNKYPDVHEGMQVFSRDGEKLGKLTYMDEDSLTIEKGLFFPKDFTIRYDDIVDFTNKKVIINQNRADLKDWHEVNYAGWDEYDRANRGETARAEPYRGEPIEEKPYKKEGFTGEGGSVSLKEEQLDVQKTMRQTGEVRIRKVVHTEMKNFSVPYSREDVVIERREVSGAPSELRPGETAFKEEEINIPLREEQIEVTKRPVTREEVRIRKETHTAQANISGEVKREDIEVTRDDDIKRKDEKKLRDEERPLNP